MEPLESISLLCAATKVVWFSVDFLQNNVNNLIVSYNASCSNASRRPISSSKESIKFLSARGCVGWLMNVFMKLVVICCSLSNLFETFSQAVSLFCALLSKNF